MKRVLISWIDSLKLLMPKNLWNFVQVVLKAWLHLYWVLFKNFWWLIIGGAIAITIQPHWLLLGLIIVGWLLGVILAARPSLKEKDFSYFIDYALYGIPLMVIFLSPCCMPTLVAYGSLPYLFLAMFFLCDAEFRLMALLVVPLRTAFMTLYKLPIYGLFALLFYVISFLPAVINFFIAMPFVVTALSRCYVIWLHKDYKDYHEGCC